MKNTNHCGEESTSELWDELELNISRLNNLQSEPLTEGYGITRNPEYQDAFTYLEDEIDAIENELDSLDDPFVEDFFK